MAVLTSHKIIWLDAFIGQNDKCSETKRRFIQLVDPNARIDDAMDRRIQAMHESEGPFIFVTDASQARSAIQKFQNKRIIFISSGSLGKEIVHEIHSQHYNIFSIYIFCALRENYRELQLDLLNSLKVFIDEDILLMRLMRDLSREFIRQGKAYAQIPERDDALTYFERAQKLQTEANKISFENEKMMSVLLELEGSDGHGGLIGSLKH